MNDINHISDMNYINNINISSLNVNTLLRGDINNKRYILNPRFIYHKDYLLYITY